MQKLLFFLVVFALFTSCSESTDVTITPLTKSWEKTIDIGGVPHGISGIKASDCGVCHTEIYNEWKISTHALAWKDLQYQKELKKESSPFVCLNCHIPLKNQQEFIVEGLINGDYFTPKTIENPHFDAKLKEEAITCAVCHVRNSKIIAKNTNSFAPHPIQQDAAALSEKLCFTCHNATDTLNPMLVCTFETGKEWSEFDNLNTGKNCISCHMDTLVRKIAVSSIENKISHRHWFAGSGIPKFFDIEQKGLNGLNAHTAFNKDKYNLNDSIKYYLELQNLHAGHRLPTGDPERFYTIQMVVFNEKSDTITDTMYRVGERWEWYPVAKKLDDNNLMIGEKRAFYLNLIIERREKLIFQTVVKKHRMTVETAKHHNIFGKYPLSIEVYNFNDTIVVR